MSEENKPMTLAEHIAASKQNTSDLESMQKAYDDVEPVGGGRYASAKAAAAGELTEHVVINGEVSMVRTFGSYKLESPDGSVPMMTFVEQFNKDVTKKPAEVVAAAHAEMRALSAEDSAAEEKAE